MTDQSSTTRRVDAVTVTVLVFVALAPVFLALHLWRRTTLQEMTVEDGLVEYVTAIGFLAAAVCFAAAGFAGRARKLWVLPLSLVCFFVAGEEVSWGQRLLGLGTPSSLEAVNVQGETNLHNIEGIHGVVRAAAVLVLLAVFALLPLAVQRWRVARRLNERLRLPVPRLVVLALIVVGVGFMAGPRLLVGEESFALDEVGELYVAAAWLLYAVTALSSSGSVRGRAAGTRSSTLQATN